MNLKNLALPFIMSGSIAFAEGNAQRPYVTTITSGSHVIAKDRGLFKGDIDEIVVASGSAFLMESNGKPFLITAAHCVVLSNEQAAEITKCNENKVEMGEIRISGFALKPTRFLLDSANDIAVVELAAEDIKLLNLRPLKSTEPKLPCDAMVWGFPFKPGDGGVVANQVGTPDLRKATISHIDTRMLTASIDNGQTGSGYSGGPMVVGDSDNVIGVTVAIVPGVGNTQTRGCNMKHVEALLAAFETKATKYSDPPIH